MSQTHFPQIDQVKIRRIQEGQLWRIMILAYDNIWDDMFNPDAGLNDIDVVSDKKALLTLIGRYLEDHNLSEKYFLTIPKKGEENADSTGLLGSE